MPRPNTTSDPAVVMSRSLPRAMESVVVAFLLLVFVLCLVPPAFEPLDQHGPADYSDQVIELLKAVTITVVWLVLGVFGPATRAATLLPTGPKTGVGWDQVTQVAVARSIVAQRVRLSLRSGRSYTLALPRGSPWRRDRAFRIEVEFVHAYAVAHGAVLGPVRSRHFRTLLLSLLPFVLIGAIAGTRVGQRGAIWPWSPRLTAPPPCQALATGLDQVWPTSQRRLTDDSPYTCAWQSTADDSAYLTANVTITTETMGIDLSAVSRAKAAYRDDVDQSGKASLMRLTGIGDQAFTDSSGTDDVAEAQSANILVVVHLTRRGGQTDPGAAEEILRHLVGQIRVE